MSRQYDAARVRQTRWNPTDPELPSPMPLPDELALTRAKETRAAYATAAGRKHLDRMIATYLLQAPNTPPENGTVAAYREGQASVVKQILADMKLTAGDIPHGPDNT